MAVESPSTPNVVKPKGLFETVGEFRCILIMALEDVSGLVHNSRF